MVQTTVTSFFYCCVACRTGFFFCSKNLFQLLAMGGYGDQMPGMYGTLDVEVEVLRLTIRRAESTAFVCPFRVIIGLSAHVDNKIIIDGLWKGQMKCIGAEANDADL